MRLNPAHAQVCVGQQLELTCTTNETALVWNFVPHLINNQGASVQREWLIASEDLTQQLQQFTINSTSFAFRTCARPVFEVGSVSVTLEWIPEEGVSYSVSGQVVDFRYTQRTTTVLSVPYNTPTNVTITATSCGQDSETAITSVELAYGNYFTKIQLQH